MHLGQKGIVIKYGKNLLNNKNIVNIIYNTINKYLNEENIYTVKSGDSLYAIAKNSAGGMRDSISLLDQLSILGVSKDAMMKHVNKIASIHRVHPEGRRLSYEIADKINDLKLSGVYLVKESKRYYPYDTLLSHSLGFVGIDNQGLAGLELIYDFKLCANMKPYIPDYVNQTNTNQSIILIYRFK